MSQTFGRRLRALREEQGLTRRQLEDESGVSQRQIEYLEKDEKDPRRETLEALARVLGAEVVQAAFPKLAILPNSRKSSTAREVSLADWAMAAEADDLVPALAVR